MSSTRKRDTPEEKARIAFEALKGDTTQSQITSKYGVHGSQISTWKRELKRGMADIFRDKRGREERDKDQLIEDLYRKIGQLQIEQDWLKKNLNYSIDTKRQLVDHGHPSISVSHQCDLLSLSRSSFYYQAEPIDDSR